jgi:AhpD family alkylhydroperoxidase
MTRTPLGTLAREGYRKVIELEGYVAANVDDTLKNLIYLRASLMNGCTFCVDSHSTDLLNGGMQPRKIFSVTTWRDSSFYDERERMAFELTEAITNISGGVSDKLWDSALTVFSEKELGDLILAISTIGVWNRIGVSTHLPTPPLD